MRAVAGLARRRRILIPLITALFVGLPLTAGAQSLANTKELLALAPHDANSKARSDLLSLLKPVESYRRGMFRRVHGVTLAGRPFGTRFEGVCEQDNLIVDYAPARAASTDGNPDYGNPEHVESAPLEPYGFSTLSNFHIEQLPAGRRTSMSVVSAWQPACDPERLNDKAAWFTAANVHDAVLGANMLRMAADQLRGGTLTPSPCPNIVSEESCAKAILDVADLAKLNSVDNCTVDIDAPCVILNLNFDTELVITGKLDPNDDIRLTPATILSIRVRNFVVVT